MGPHPRPTMAGESDRNDPAALMAEAGRAFQQAAQLYIARAAPAPARAPSGGPGAPERSHAPDEWIGTDEIRGAAQAYRRIVETWMDREDD